MQKKTEQNRAEPLLTESGTIKSTKVIILVKYEFIINLIVIQNIGR